MVYQGFKVLKRFPLFYYPRLAGIAFLCVIGRELSAYFVVPYIQGFDEFGDPNTVNYIELKRQYNERKSAEFRDFILK